MERVILLNLLSGCDGLPINDNFQDPTGEGVIAFLGIDGHRTGAVQTDVRSLIRREYDRLRSFDAITAILVPLTRIVAVPPLPKPPS